MKIITWNCNMAFRKKAGYILAHKPDILVVPECEHPDNLVFPVGIPEPKDLLWFGKNQHKGLGIFSYSEYRFSVLTNHNQDFKMIVPIAVTGGDYDFILFAIWANNPDDPDGQYVEQVWKAINYYDAVLNNKPVILTGDFNSNTIWDRKSREGNHSTVVRVLKDKGIVSTYHAYYKQEQGKEAHPTFYLFRHCFVSADLAVHLISVEIGEHRVWKKHSDHVPVIVRFGSKRKTKKTIN